MGGGYWDTKSYSSLRALRRSKGEDDFAYTNTQEARSGKIYETLDPRRINKKPFGKLESRDSVDHPASNAVMVCFDVTGSNISRAVEAQKKLPNLMEMLEKYLPDPQVAVAANDDYNFVRRKAFQISDYESDNRVDEHIRNVILVGEGGSNSGESYDLCLYAAARKTVLDCMEKRQRKGYLFMYADEPFFDKVDKDVVNDVFGDSLQASIPIKTIIKEVQQLYNVYIIWPTKGYIEARDQYIKLFGDESVLTLQDPNLICELIGSVIGINEERLKVEDVESALVSVGTSAADAATIAKAVGRKFRDEASA